MSKAVIYLDNNATTRIDPRVLDAMRPYFDEYYGNPSSLHHFGARVGADLETAREKVASLIGARESEIVFTSGGTEADNTALRGVVAARPNRRHLIVSSVEHHAILEPAELLEREGAEVTRVPVDREGRLDLDALVDAIRDDTLLVSIMLANNETGAIHPLKDICEIAHGRGVLVHTDAVNAIGKTPVSVRDLGVDLLSLSAHKFYGPKGVGALFIRRGTPFRPMMIGGSQERQRRGGTQNVAGIVALGTACRIVRDEEAADAQRIAELRDRLENGVRRSCPNAVVIASAAKRLPNTSCVCFEGCSSQAVLLLLSEAGICASSGSACSSGSLEPSHVLSAMRVDPRLAQGQVRFSLGRFNTANDVDELLEVLPEILRRVAKLDASDQAGNLP